MTSVNILHIASFSGNIGDNANHIGFRNWLQENSARPIKWTELEIRQFFWKERAWDCHLIEYINSFDALIIGGGNYFELWVESSPTGTSISIEPTLWSKITVPVFFNALGVDPGQGVPNKCRERFTAFLDTILSDKHTLVSVRNDGAKKNLAQYIGKAYADAVLHAPDNGFFANIRRVAKINLFSDSRVNRCITFNLASDMPDIRFGAYPGGVDAFTSEIVATIVDLSQRMPEIGFLFAPHIFRDLDVINRVIERLPDRLRRTRIAQTPYGTGDAAAQQVFSYYASSDVCVGTRFHANVVPIGSLRQTLGLVSYPQISALYEELGQPDRCIDISAPGFSVTLADRIMAALLRPEESFSGTPQQAMESAAALRRSVTPRVCAWLSRI